jgi:hypothetical protein
MGDTSQGGADAGDRNGLYFVQIAFEKRAGPEQVTHHYQVHSGGASLRESLGAAGALPCRRTVPLIQKKYARERRKSASARRGSRPRWQGEGWGARQGRRAGWRARQGRRAAGAPPSRPLPFQPRAFPHSPLQRASILPPRAYSGKYISRAFSWRICDSMMKAV